MLHINCTVYKPQSMFVHFVLLHNDVLFEGICSVGIGPKHNLKPRGPRPCPAYGLLPSKGQSP